MSDRLQRAVAGVAVVVVVLPLAVLAVRAAADVWRAPALLPQRWGTRGIDYILSPSAGTANGLVNSLAVALVATAVALLVGWPAARVLGERRLPRPGPALLVLAAPLLVSQYATGTGLAAWFIRLGIADTLTGLVLAHLVYVVPYVVLLLAPAFGTRVRELEEAASSLGAGRLRRLLLVTVPAMRAPLAIAALLGFLVSLSQYGTSLAVGGGLPTLPLVLLPFVQTDPQIAAALSLVFLVPALAALAVAMRAARQA